MTCPYEMARFFFLKEKHMHTHEGTSLIIILEKYIRKLTVAIIDNAAAV